MLLSAPRVMTHLDDDDGLLHDVVDLGLDEVEQRADAAFRRLLHLDGTTSDGAHRLAHKVHVNLCSIPTSTHNISSSHINLLVTVAMFLFMLKKCSLTVDLVRRHLLFEFGQHLGDVRLVSEADHDVELLQLHVDWIVVLNEENFHLVF